MSASWSARAAGGSQSDPKHRATLLARKYEHCGIGLPVFMSILDAHSVKLKGLKPIPTGGLMGYAYAENVWLEG